MAQRYKDGNFPSSGPDCFEAWLSERVHSLRNKLDFANEKAGWAKQEARAYKKQRNIALALCIVFFVIALLFFLRSLRPAPAQEAQQPEAALTSSSPQVQNYVASINSDKYHRLTCDFASNILEENRVYYETPADAELDGKNACSVCRP